MKIAQMMQIKSLIECELIAISPLHLTLSWVEDSVTGGSAGIPATSVIDGRGVMSFQAMCLMVSR